MNSQDVFPATGRTHSVGTPIEEARLTSTAIAEAAALLLPGPGRSLLAMTEVEIGFGRPDILLLAASRPSLKARIRRGLRLHTFAEARILSSIVDGSRPAYSPSHTRSVIRRLEQRGWIEWVRSKDTNKRLIADSLLIEAKMKDWRGGITQLGRTRWFTNKSALLLPNSCQHLVPRKMLSHNKLGLLLAGDNNSLIWKIQPRQQSQTLLADLWLSELAARHIDETTSDSLGLAK